MKTVKTATLLVLTLLVLTLSCSGSTLSPVERQKNPNTQPNTEVQSDTPPPNTPSTPSNSVPNTPPDSENPVDGCDQSERIAVQPNASDFANLMLLVDRSGSMGSNAQWESMLQSLTQVTNDLESEIHFGLALFPSIGFLPCAAGTVSVPPQNNAAADIQSVIHRGTPLGGTPTADSLQAIGQYLLSNHSQTRNYILLATDGGPGCNTDLDWRTCECIPESPTCMLMPHNCLDDERTINVIRDLHLSGIDTYVVGIPGSESVSDILDLMAQAGGRATGNSHYAVSDQSSLSDALTQISSALANCSFQLEMPDFTPTSIKVELDQVALPQDPTGQQGWEITPTGRLTIFGDACDTLQDGQIHRLEAIFSCQD